MLLWQSNNLSTQDPLALLCVILTLTQYKLRWHILLNKSPCVWFSIYHTIQPTQINQNKEKRSIFTKSLRMKEGRRRKPKGVCHHNRRSISDLLCHWESVPFLILPLPFIRIEVFSIWIVILFLFIVSKIIICWVNQISISIEDLLTSPYTCWLVTYHLWKRNK